MVLELQEEIRRSGCTLPIIFLTAKGGHSFNRKKPCGTGRKIFCKNWRPKEGLLEAVKRALLRDSTERVKVSIRNELLARFDQLTEREMEVLKHVVSGKNE